MKYFVGINKILGFDVNYIYENIELVCLVCCF